MAAGVQDTGRKKKETYLEDKQGLHGEFPQLSLGPSCRERRGGGIPPHNSHMGTWTSHFLLATPNPTHTHLNPRSQPTASLIPRVTKLPLSVPYTPSWPDLLPQLSKPRTRPPLIPTPQIIRPSSPCSTNPVSKPLHSPLDFQSHPQPQVP